MRRILILALLLGSLAFPATVLGFHHGGLSSTSCAADAAGSPSNNNGEAKAGLARSPNQLPLAPVGTPGNGRGQGDEHCANAQED